MKCVVTDSHVAWNASAEPGSELSKRTRARSGTTNNNTQMNIERRIMRGQLDSYRTKHVKTQNTRRTTAEEARRTHASRLAHTYGHAEVTVSAMRLTDGSRRAFRGTGHSKIHDSPLCARTNASETACVRAQRC